MTRSVESIPLPRSKGDLAEMRADRELTYELGPVSNMIIVVAETNVVRRLLESSRAWG